MIPQLTSLSLAVFVLAQLFAVPAFGAGRSREMFFSTPVNLSHAQSAQSYGARVLLDGAGNIDVVWADLSCQFPSPCVSHVFFSRSADAGQSFSTPRDISNGNPAFEPGIAVDRRGNIDVVWEELQQIYFSRSSDDGVTFSTPVLLSNLAELAFSPRIAVDRAGRINVAWQSQPASSFFISNVSFARSFDGGLHFSAPRNLCDVVDVCSSVEIAVEATGGVDIVWAQAPCAGCQFDVFFSRSDDRGATFSVPENLSDGGAPLVTAPLLAVDEASNIHVIWSEGDFASTVGVQYRRSADHGLSFSTAMLSSSPGLSHSPRVGVDGGGRINVFWLDGAIGGIFFTRSVDGGATFSTPKSISGVPTGFSSSDPYMAVGRDGSADIVWGDGVENGILFRRSTDGGRTFSSPKNLWNGTTASFFPQVMTDASGNVAVAWFAEVAGGSGTDVYITRGFSLDSLENDIAALPPSAFKARGLRQAMLAQLAVVERALARDGTLLAVIQLEGLMRHLNGCGVKPDNSDWITDCPTQLKIRNSIDLLIQGLGD